MATFPAAITSTTLPTTALPVATEGGAGSAFTPNDSDGSAAQEGTGGSAATPDGSTGSDTTPKSNGGSAATLEVSGGSPATPEGNTGFAATPKGNVGSAATTEGRTESAATPEGTGGSAATSTHHSNVHSHVHSHSHIDNDDHHSHQAVSATTTTTTVTAATTTSTSTTVTTTLVTMTATTTITTTTRKRRDRRQSEACACTCNGRPDPVECSLLSHAQCSSALIGVQVKSGCPVLCGTCRLEPTTTLPPAGPIRVSFAIVFASIRASLLSEAVRAAVQNFTTPATTVTTAVSLGAVADMTDVLITPDDVRAVAPVEENKVAIQQYALRYYMARVAETRPATATKAATTAIPTTVPVSDSSGGSSSGDDETSSTYILVVIVLILLLILLCSFCIACYRRHDSSDQNASPFSRGTEVMDNPLFVAKDTRVDINQDQGMYVQQNRSFELPTFNTEDAAYDNPPATHRDVLAAPPRRDTFPGGSEQGTPQAVLLPGSPGDIDVDSFVWSDTHVLQMANVPNLMEARKEMNATLADAFDLLLAPMYDDVVDNTYQNVACPLMGSSSNPQSPVPVHEGQMGTPPSFDAASSNDYFLNTQDVYFTPDL